MMGIDAAGIATGLRRLRSRLAREEDGFALLEIVVSALLLVIVSVGVLGAVEAATRSTSEERHRARAHSLAQDDLARMRAMKISDLSNLNQTRILTSDGTPYSIASRAEFATDSTGTASCEAGVAAADYILITSTVSWPSMGARPPVNVQSIVAPPNGSVSANSGSLAIRVEDGANEGLAGVGLSGSGAGSFSGSTGSNGCVIFGNLPAGNYTLSISGSSLVDRDGNPPAPQSTSVVAESTNTLVLQYDTPGSVAVDFTTRVGGSLVPSSADAIVAFNTGMSTSKSFGTPGTRLSTVTAAPLFPFTSPYSVYAGTCEGDNPNPTGEESPPGAAAIASVLVAPGGNQVATIELPALHLTAWSGTDASSPGSPLQNARVRLADANCPDGGAPIKRTFATDASGHLADPGLPYSDYDVCVDNGAKRVSVPGVSVKDLAVGTTLDVFLGSPAAVTGTCP